MAKRSTIRSIDRIGAFAVLRSSLEHREERAGFVVDFSVVAQAPFPHLIGVDVNLFDAARVEAVKGQPFEHHLHELDVRGRKVFRATDLDEARVVLWPRPNDDNEFIHGTILLLRLDNASMTEGGAESIRAPGRGASSR